MSSSKRSSENRDDDRSLPNLRQTGSAQSLQINTKSGKNLEQEEYICVQELVQKRIITPPVLRRGRTTTQGGGPKDTNSDTTIEAADKGISASALSNTFINDTDGTINNVTSLQDRIESPHRQMLPPMQPGEYLSPRLTFFDDIRLKQQALRDIDDHRYRYDRFKQTFLNNQIQDFLISHREAKLSPERARE